MARPTSITATPIELTIEFDDDGPPRRFNRFWLRDNCPADGEREGLFRDFTADRIAADLTIDDAVLDGDSVLVEFSDGCRDSFAAGWLAAYGRTDVGDRSWKSWRSGFEPAAFEAAMLAAGGVDHHALLEAIQRDGFALVMGLGSVDSTERLAGLLGPIRETDFGRVFDIVTEPQPFTPSQSAVALDPHTDDPYRYSPAGMSILHCLMPSEGNGGESSIVDGFAIAESIRATDPDAFHLLASVRVPFVHRRAETVDQGADVHLRAAAPIIAVDERGVVCGVRFHERSMGTLDVDADLAERYYPALMRFSAAVRGDEFVYRRHLGAGEALVYDNQRVLHGRSGFEGAQTRRHLRLCTVDRDQVHSRLRRLRERYATGSERDRLPAGNLS